MRSGTRRKHSHAVYVSFIDSFHVTSHSYRNAPLAGKTLNQEDCVHIPASSACLCKLCIINVVITEFDLLILLF